MRSADLQRLIPFSKRAKWRKAESQGLAKATWDERIVLCINLNPLRRGVKRVKAMNAEEVSTKIELTKAVEAIGRYLYKGNIKRKKTQYMNLTIGT